MIAHLRGQLIVKSADRIIIDVAGVGYEVFVPLKLLTQLPDINKPVALFIETIVREDDISLYGFIKLEERDTFRLLREAKGVGVKTAFSLLSFYEADQIINIIVEEDISSLLAVPGIGRKTAERIMFELKDRAKKISDRPHLTKSSQIESDVELALISLGYTVKEAKEAIGKSKAELSDTFSLEDMIKVALKKLVKG